MSHVATIEIEVKDLDALAEAAKACGLVLNRGQKTYRWYGRWVNDYSAADAAYRHDIKPEDYGKCEHAISVPGNAKAYEIGVVRKANGSFGLVWDFFAGGHGLMEKCSIDGKAAGKLVQEYSTAVAVKKAKQQGFAVQRKQLADGRVQLQLTR